MVYKGRRASSNRSSPPLGIQSALFVLVGVLAGFVLATLLRQSLLNCSKSSCCPYHGGGGQDGGGGEQQQQASSVSPLIFSDIEDSKRLVFIGVMTAQKYLDTRAKSVYETWGRNPIAFIWNHKLAQSP